MKKVLMICLVVVMAFSLAVPMFAEPGSFLESPSKKPDPTLVEAILKDEDCGATVVLTPYGERHNLPAETRQLLEFAYSMIAGASDLSDLTDALTVLAEGLGIDINDLSVSDLFDISVEGCTEHSVHHVDITLKAEYLENFVCLIHYHNGEWVIVDGAEVTNNGEHLEFDVAEMSPFAIVVDTSDVDEDTPPTSDSDIITWICVAAAALVVMFVILIILGRKKRTSEE